jgi:hypothetical protein
LSLICCSTFWPCSVPRNFFALSMNWDQRGWGGGASGHGAESSCEAWASERLALTPSMMDGVVMVMCACVSERDMAMYSANAEEPAAVVRESDPERCGGGCRLRCRHR